MNDMIACGQNMDIKAFKCRKVIQEVKDAVKEWPAIAHSVKISEKTISLIHKEIECNSAE